MGSRSPSSPGNPSRRHICLGCNLETWTTADAPACDHCGDGLKADPLASAILSPPREQMDETLTAYLAAPLPEEALLKTANPENLFGKYVFLRELGRGASGTVIKAWDTYLSRDVALKFLHATAGRNTELNDTQRVQDFLREARLAARLQHPNIVPIHEVDCREGRYFISMEFVNGGTLAEQIHGPVGARVRTRFYSQPLHFLQLLRTIALAVHHAHCQAPPVVHRDLKPQNVLIDAQHKPFVADFGLANEVQVEPGNGAGGGIRGTPAYMSPEQALGHTEHIDPRTDVYSLGVILYEMLTGEPPFKGSNIPSVLRKVATDPPEAPSAVVERTLRQSKDVAACPAPMRAALEAICLKALAKNREDRYESAIAFANALALWTNEPVAQAKRPPAGRKRAKVATVLGAAALLILLSSSMRLHPPSAIPATSPAAHPGDDLALVAAGYPSSGQWAALRGAVAELRRKAPQHPRLGEFAALLADRDRTIDQSRSEWSLRMDRIASAQGNPDVPDLQRRLREFPETEEEFRSALQKALARRESALLAEAAEIAASGPGEAWRSQALKSRAESLRNRMAETNAFAQRLEEGFDLRPLTLGIVGLERMIAWQGTWTLRVNVIPFAEVRVLEGDVESAREFTPTAFSGLEIGRTGTTVELSWPSVQDPKRRWSGRPPPLEAGDTLVVSGDLEHPELQVVRK